MVDLARLKHRLARELAQSERATLRDCRREAKRLRKGPAADAMSAIAAHAEAQRLRLQALRVKRPATGLRVRRLVTLTLALLRHVLFARVVDVERSYRGTLLSVHRGIGVARLLAEVAMRDNDRRLLGFCDEWLAVRRPLVETAEEALAWFAERSQRVLRPGLGHVLERG